jgi:hypothetical protein
MINVYSQLYISQAVNKAIRAFLQLIFTDFLLLLPSLSSIVLEPLMTVIGFFLLLFLFL